MPIDLIRAYLTVTMPRLRAAVPDVFWIVGLAMVAFGIGRIYAPAGYIAAGLGLCFVGYAVGDAE